MVHVPPQHTLTRRVFGAAAWTASGFAISIFIRFASTLLLTRLLTPDAFGLVAMATVFITGLALFSDLGLQTHIIQSQRGSEPNFLNTAWTVQIVRGLFLTIVALLIAAGLAYLAQLRLLPSSSVFADPQLPSLIAALSATALISGFLSTKYFEASRRLALGRVTAIEIAAQIIGLIVTLSCLWYERSVWALVLGTIAGALVSTVLSHAALPGINNRLCGDRSAAYDLLNFGKWIFLSSALTFFATSADKLILGAMTGAAFLGFYTIAFNLVDVPAQLIGRLLGSVAFPGLSQVARERAWDLKRIYYKFHSLFAPAVYLTAGTLVMASPTIVAILYDPRYRDSGWIMQILAIMLMATPFRLAGQCFIALGKPQLISILLVARLMGLVLAMPLGFYLFQLQGAIGAVVFSQLCVLPVTLFYLRKFGLLDVSKELLALIAFPVGLAAGFSINYFARVLLGT